MIINKIVLNNVGVFSGKQEFCLQVQNQNGGNKPIVIFGGMNGSGKTTIFDAIKLCLYGSDLFPRMSQAKYTKYLKEKINHSGDSILNPNFASIEIEFEHSKNGQLDKYAVERNWEHVGKKLHENIIVKKNEDELDTIENQYWQDFIRELIPIGLSELFFFDGEKIRKLISDENNIELEKSIKSLIGLDLLDSLKSDLKIYKTKNLRDLSDEKLNNEYEQYEKEKNLIEANINKTKDKLSDCKVNLEKLTETISNYENKIAAQGGTFLQKRSEFLERKNSLEYELEAIKESLRETASGLLPLSISKGTSLKLRETILLENETRSHRIVSKVLSNKKKELIRMINNKVFLAEIDANQKELILGYMKAKIENIFEPEEKEYQALIFDLSEKQTLRILSNLDECIESIPISLKELTQQYESKYRELKQVLSNIEKVPDEELIKPMYEKLNDLNRELGKNQSNLEHIESTLADFNNQRNEIERNIERLESKMEQNRKVDEKLTLVNRTEKVLNEYRDRIAKNKIQKLEEEFSKIFKTLHRKEDMITNIKINPDNFEVDLYDKRDNRINKNNLSSGELEIYAISMLWSLAIISGQKLPFIIDTPLARLDTKHRDNLINLFFPRASHQMVIFSTDTEVDREYFDKLKPYVSKSYFLEYDNQKETTLKREGYFWN